jgi:uncharacterized protein YajQ (UPF0234 family)
MRPIYRAVAETMQKLRKRFDFREVKNSNDRNEKALKDQGFDVTNMAEAMGFELMDLLQSTVFKTVALNHSATPPIALRAP